jgi:Fe-S oxidoreductase
MDVSILQSILTLLLVVGTGYFTLARLARVVVLVNTGRRDEVLTETPGERIGKVVRLVLGHEKVLEDRWAGLMHMTYIYGFLVLSVGHVEVVLEGLSAFLAALGKTPFGYEHFLPSGVTAVYHLSQDVVAALVLVVASVALVRRWSGKVARLMPRSMDAEIILYLIVALYVTFFGLVGSGVLLDMRASGEFDLRAASPVSSVVAWALASLPAGLIPWVRGASWWGHVLVFLGFACYITISKHMHLIFAVPNIYFFRRQRRGLPPAIDFEEAEKFGIDRVQELPWKSLLDTFACTECGRCNVVCPAHLTGKPLKPMKVLHDIKANLRVHNAEGLLALRDARGRPIPEKAEEEEAWEPKTPLISQVPIDQEIAGSVRFDGAYTQVDGQVHVDELWACTTCGACMEVCPVLIDSVPGSLVGLRQSLVMMESSFPKEVTSAFKGMEVQGNPWGVGQDQRLEWAAGLEVPVMADIAAEGSEREVEYLFWVGCAGATDDRAKRVQQALVRVLKAAGVDFAILGREEKCTGDMARRLGNEYLFNSLAQENIETLGKYKFQKILTTCPHCLNTLKNEYRELGTGYTVVHHTQLLSELLAAGRLPTLETPSRGAVTFHDPCYLGRYNDGYQPPRDVLNRIGAEAREMELSQQRAMCCGAGGGRMFIEEPLGKRVNEERTEQALATGAETIAVGCPFCMTMLTDGTKAKEAEERVRVKDLAELVAERLAPEETSGVTSSHPAGETTG